MIEVEWTECKSAIGMAHATYGPWILMKDSSGDYWVLRHDWSKEDADREADRVGERTQWERACKRFGTNDAQQQQLWWVAVGHNDPIDFIHEKFDTTRWEEDTKRFSLLT